MCTYINKYKIGSWVESEVAVFSRIFAVAFLLFLAPVLTIF